MRRMMFMKRTFIALAFVIFAVPAVLSPRTTMAAEDNQLTLAVIRTEEMSALAKRWEVAIAYLKEHHQLDINFYTTTSYASVVEAMLSGFVDIGSLGPKIYLVAHDKSEGAIEPIISYALPADMFMDEPCGCYYGAFVTKKGSGLTTIESTKGKVLALVDPGSTSGNALPRALFGDQIGGATLDDYFGRIFYSGSHTASGRAIQSGKADAAFISLGTLRRLISSGEHKKEDYNYLWRSPQIPIDVLAVDKTRMKPEMIERVRKAFVGMSDTPEGQEVLKAMDFAAFLPAEDSRFDPLRKILAVKAELKKKSK